MSFHRHGWASPRFLALLRGQRLNLTVSDVVPVTEAELRVHTDGSLTNSEHCSLIERSVLSTT